MQRILTGARAMKTNNVDTTRAVEKLISYKQAIVDDGRIVLTPLWQMYSGTYRARSDRKSRPRRRVGIQSGRVAAGIRIPLSTACF